MTGLTLGEAAQRLRNVYEHHASEVAQILRRHGAQIEANAAVITPVDKGFLRRANTSKVQGTNEGVTLTIENRMIYARYQHDYPHNHTQPMATDHFIEIPFKAELPAIVADIVDADIRRAQA